EETFGKLLAHDLKPYRDELFISTKAGSPMWEGPYGNFGSKKYFTASVDQSLKRMGLDYVDVFYHHHPAPETTMAETLAALDFIVRRAKALYAGSSKYSRAQTAGAVRILNALGTPLLIHQVNYSMLRRDPEEGLFQVLEQEGVGC